MKNVIVLICTLCSAMALPCFPAEKVEIFFPGSVSDLDLPNYGRDLKGAKFLVLYEKGGKAYIGEAKVTYLDGVISSDTANAITYFRGLPLKIGEVEMADIRWEGKSRPPRGKKKGFPHVTERGIKIALKGGAYFIYKGRHSFVLTSKNEQLRLYAGSDDLVIIWAGDIDGDGRLDLIVEKSDDQGKSAAKCLLLSSLAKRPGLVKEFACQIYGG